MADGEVQPVPGNGELVSSDGVIMCIECEDQRAELRCVACDDCYCDPCFVFQHKRGRRKMHATQRLHAAETEQEAGATAAPTV